MRWQERPLTWGVVTGIVTAAVIGLAKLFIPNFD